MYIENLKVENVVCLKNPSCRQLIIRISNVDCDEIQDLFFRPEIQPHSTIGDELDTSLYLLMINSIERSLCC